MSTCWNRRKLATKRTEGSNDNEVRRSCLDPFRDTERDDDDDDGKIDRGAVVGRKMVVVKGGLFDNLIVQKTRKHVVR